MKKHTVFVAGKRFILLSDEKEEYVQKVAQEVNDAIIAITSANPTLDSRACAILCALDQADDKYKEIIKNQRFSQKAKDVMIQSEKHAKTVREMKNEIQKAKKLNEQQLHQIADKNVEIKSLSNKVKSIADENIALKSENKKLKDEIEKLKNLQQSSKNIDKKPEKKINSTPVKKQPYQNPVAKSKNSTEKNKFSLSDEVVLNQMSLFENE